LTVKSSSEITVAKMTPPIGTTALFDLTVQVVGAPPILVTLDEVGLVLVSNLWCRRPDVAVVAEGDDCRFVVTFF
jgi:hypothetical protein